MNTTPAENNTDNSIVAMRGILFETLRALSDKDNPMDIERAKMISDVSQTIINSAKVEVDALKIIGGKGSGFIPSVGISELPADHSIPGITKHRIK